MGPSLQILAPNADILRNLEVLLREGVHLVTELGGCAPALDFNLTRNCPELVYIARSNLFLNSQELQVELLLVVLLEEGDEELACLEDLRSQHCVQKALIVLLALCELPWELFFNFCGRQRWNHDLWIGA